MEVRVSGIPFARFDWWLNDKAREVAEDLGLAVELELIAEAIAEAFSSCGARIFELFDLSFGAVEAFAPPLEVLAEDELVGLDFFGLKCSGGFHLLPNRSVQLGAESASS